MTITSTGIGSGLDVEAIVSQLMAVERQPLTLLQGQESSINTQLSAFGKLQSLTSTLRDAASSLTSLTLWKKTTATSSDTNAVTVSAADGAAAGSYAVSVQALATGQTAVSGAFASSTSTLSAGTLTITLGRYGGEPSPTGFTPKDGATPVSIAIGDGETSLESIRDKINAAQAGVTASIVTDAGGARIALRSAATGAENAFRVDVAETVDDGSASSGLSALAFDAAAASPMTRTQTAGNAEATINGIAVSSAGNTLDGVVDGLTLNLLRTTAGSVDVSVAADTGAVRNSITNFVSAFNAVASYIQTQTKYDAGTKTAGTLQGDRSTLSVQSQLRAVLNAPSGASSVYTQLSDIGITMQRDGTLAVDSGHLDNAIANLPELRKVLANDGGDSASSGFIDRFKDLATALLDTGGTFDSRTQGLQSRIDSLDRQQSAMETRLANTETRLRKQYQALDTQMSTLSGLSAYLTNQLAGLAATGN